MALFLTSTYNQNKHISSVKNHGKETWHIQSVISIEKTGTLQIMTDKTWQIQFCQLVS